MLSLKMEYLGLDVNIECGSEYEDMHVNNRLLLGKIEDFLDHIHLYEKVKVTISSKNYEQYGTDTLTVHDDNMGDV